MADDYEPFDAYELGRAAAATLQAHNSQLSYELPSALQTLFSNNEFQEAIVVGGVVSDRVTLGRIIQQGFNPPSRRHGRVVTRSEGSQNQGMAIPELTATPQTIRPMTRREQLALRSRQRMDHSEISAANASPASEKQKSVIPLPKIPSPVKSLKSCRNFPGASSSVLSDTQQRGSGGVSKDVPEHPQGSPLNAEVSDLNSYHLTVSNIEESICSSGSENELTIPVNDVPIPIGRPFLCLASAETKETKGQTTAFTATQATSVGEEQSVTCLTCDGHLYNGINDPENVSDSTESKSWMKKCREMMWLMLGMDKKQYDKDEECPFCHDCLKKAEKCYWMSLQILGIQQSYDEICESIQLGLVTRLLPKTSVVQNLRGDRLDSLKRGILQKMKNSNGPTLVQNENIHIKTVGKIMLEYESSNNHRIDGNDSANASTKESEESVATKNVKHMRSRKCPKSKKRRLEEDNGTESRLKGYSSSDNEEGQRLSFKNIKSMRECGLKKSDLDHILKTKVVAKNTGEHCNQITDPAVMFRCSKCPCGLSDRESLKLHLQEHSSINIETGRYKCFICDEKFKSLVEIRQHKATHTIDAIFECSYCDEFFGSKQKKANHELIHFLPTAVCEVCAKRFVNQKSLKKHMASHIRNPETDSRHICKFCEKKFTCKSNLDEHIRRHKGIKPLKCQLCHETFHRYQHARVHFRKIHPLEDPDKNTIKVV